MGSYEAELATAIAVATEAGALAKTAFGSELETKRKDDGSWATDADLRTEELIRKRIAEAFPDHNILGEEDGLLACGGGPAIEGAPTWIVDPIDGTNNFMAEIPVWATLIGLRIQDETVVGVCNAPALGELYSAAIGSGAWMNGKRIYVDDVDDLGDAFVIHSGAGRFEEAGLKAQFDAVVRRSHRDRGFGDFWGHVLVARGAASVSLEPGVSLWDIAALQPIVGEAGGKLTKLGGGRWIDSGSVLATNGRLHDTVAALFAGYES